MKKIFTLTLVLLSLVAHAKPTKGTGDTGSATIKTLTNGQLNLIYTFLSLIQTPIGHDTIVEVDADVSCMQINYKANEINAAATEYSCSDSDENSIGGKAAETLYKMFSSKNSDPVESFGTGPSSIIRYGSVSCLLTVDNINGDKFSCSAR